LDSAIVECAGENTMQKIETKLDQVVERLVNEFKPEKIILFGSHAWGTPRADSDVDLMVIVKSSPLIPTRRAAQAYRCLQGLKVPVEVIVSTQNEIERYRSVPASLTHKILKDGQVLYGRS
jgi:predicted nucleotidyltransferase